MDVAKIRTEIRFKKQLETLERQFLCCYPVIGISWEDWLPTITWEQQAQILKVTCRHKLNQSHPIKLEYQLKFLQHLLQVLEFNGNIEIHDDIYNEFCKIQKNLSEACTEEFAYKHYLVPEFESELTMREAKSFVGKGTTGLCTWQASLALTDFLLHNPEIVKGKKILELGAGTGFCGLMLSLCKLAKHVIMTDGSMECIELMQENIEINFPAAKKCNDGFYDIEESTQCLGAFRLPWETVDDFEFTEKLTPNLILAADIVFDDSLFESLIHTIDRIFLAAENDIKMFLAVTIRNEETLEEFMDLISTNYYSMEYRQILENESYLHWDRSCNVVILEIIRKEIK